MKDRGIHYFNNPDIDCRHFEGMSHYIPGGIGITAIEQIKLICLLAKLIRAIVAKAEKENQKIDVAQALCKIIGGPYTASTSTLEPFLHQAYSIAEREGEIPDFSLSDLKSMIDEIKRILDKYLPF